MEEIVVEWKNYDITLEKRLEVRTMYVLVGLCVFLLDVSSVWTIFYRHPIYNIVSTLLFDCLFGFFFFKFAENCAKLPGYSKLLTESDKLRTFYILSYWYCIKFVYHVQIYCGYAYVDIIMHILVCGYMYRYISCILMLCLQLTTVLGTSYTVLEDFFALAIRTSSTASAYFKRFTPSAFRTILKLALKSSSGTFCLVSIERWPYFTSSCTNMSMVFSIEVLTGINRA